MAWNWLRRRLSAQVIAITLALAFTLPAASQAREQSCPSLFAQLTAARISKEKSAALDADVLKNFDDLASLKPPTIKATTAWNSRVMGALERMPVPAKVEGEKTSLSQREIEDLYQKLKENPVAKETCEAFPNKYDPNPDNQIGFCFGRAIGAHLLAHNMGLSNDSIRKVWLVGSLKGGGTQWTHHVATAVRRDDGQWFVIDTHEMESVVSVHDWVEAFRPSGRRVNGKLMLFATKPDRFGPNYTEPLYESTITRGDYNGFFRDLFASVRENGQTLQQQLDALSK